jgi:signal transduction histidine kinase
VLHEFLVQRHHEVLGLVALKLKALTPDRDQQELLEGIPKFLEEVIRALRRDAGLSDSSPLPGRSDAAVQHGRQRQRRGFRIEAACTGFGAVCDSVTELAMAHGVAVNTREYQLLNQCVDAAVAAAIGEYWDVSQAEREHDTNERARFLVHEMRNSLAVVRLAFTSLRQGRVGVLSKTADAMERNLERMDNLIAHAAASMRLQPGSKFECTRFGLKDLLEEIQAAMLPQRGVQLDIDTPEELEVTADRRLLNSAITNLVQNALKFTHEDSTVCIRVLETPSGVQIEVEDECGGLPDGNGEELFEPFAQHGDDRSGLGLGLAITREATIAHGGRCDVRNLPGKGCIFSITIPVDCTGNSPPQSG